MALPTLRFSTRLFAAGLFAFASANAFAVQAVPTFQSLGLYWSDSGGSKETVCEVRYRKAGTTPWRTGYPLWFDGRSGVGAGTDAARPAGEFGVEAYRSSRHAN